MLIGHCKPKTFILPCLLSTTGIKVNCILQKRPTIKLSHRFNSVKYLFSVTSTKTRHGDHSSKCYCKNTCLSTCKNVVIINELRYVKRRVKMKQSYAC